MLTSGCSTAELSQRYVDEPAKRPYRYIYVNVSLSDHADTTQLSNRFIKELDQYDLQIMLSNQTQDALIHDEPGAALLKVVEVDRHLEAGEHHKRYGRTSLTQNRGRKPHIKPVITLRATLIEVESGRTVFQADYVTQGQWYADSATVVAALAGKLVKQLAHEGFITE